MELAVLILVNIITSIIIYVIFSIRFTIAVDKARKTPIVRELKDNIEATIEFINTSLDIMDQKTRSFYQLVRKSEELARRLEEVSLNEQSAGPRKRKRRSKRPVPGTSDPEPELKQAPLSPLQTPDTPDDENSDSGSGSAYSRVLDAMESDHVDLSPVGNSSDAIYQDGELSRGLARSFGLPEEASPAQNSEVPPGSRPERGALSGLLSRVGGILGRVLGAPTDASRTLPPELESEGAPPRVDREREQNFMQLMERMERKSTETGEGPARGEREQTGSRTRDRQDRLELSGERPPRPREEVSPPELVLKASSESALESAREPQAESLTESNQNEPLSPEEDLESYLRSLPVSEIPQGRERTDFIRDLLARGFEPAEISTRTGIGLPEVDLVASLPGRGRRKRTTRRVEE